MFFKRRIARLAPALALVSAVTLIVLYGFVGPIANVEVATTTAIAAAFGLGNVAAAINSGDYFNDPDNALLHLWSLGVEEQFYLVLPIIFVFLWQLGRDKISTRYRRLEILTWLTTVLSFSLALIAASEVFSSAFLQAVFGFYSPVVRAWEFGFGVGALLLARRVSLVGVVGQLMGFIGFLLVMFALFLVSTEQLTPGISTLVPVLGTAMILMGGARWLSWKPLVKLGNLSYSLYLWHWPIIFISDILLPDNFAVPLLGVIVSLFLSAITYRFVEVPFRQSGRTSSPRVLPSLIGVSLIPVVVAFALFSYGESYWRSLQSLGLPASFEGELGNEEYFGLLPTTFYPCENDEYSKVAPVRFGLTICFQSKPVVEPTVAIIGDSHAEHLLAGFAQELPNHGIVVLVTNRFRGPVFASDETEDLIRAIEEDESLQVVVLAAWWEEADWTPDDLASVSERLISSGKSVFLASGSHSFSFHASRCKHPNNLYWSLSRTCEEPLIDRSSQKAAARGWAEDNQIRVIDIETNLCAEACSMVSDDGVMMYRDSHHFTIFGSRVALANRLGDIETLLENKAEQDRRSWRVLP